VKSDAASNDSEPCTLKVALRPVPWSRGPSTQSIFVAELSTLISFLLSTRTMTESGNLLLRLANGWAFDLVGGGAFKMTVTLSCRIEPCGPTKSALVDADFLDELPSS
jgi:hypothetical protein